MRALTAPLLAVLVSVSAACDDPQPRASGGPRTTVDSGVAPIDASARDAETSADAAALDDGGTRLDAGGATDSGAGTMDASVPRPPSGAFLYVGAGGGGPTTDLYVDAVATAMSSAGNIEVGEVVPSDLSARFGLLALMNPLQAVPSAVATAAAAHLAAGGRVLLVMEHCKNGCWGNAEGDNALLAALGSDMRLSGSGGAPLSETALELTQIPGITAGVSSLVVYYSGSVDVGSGVALGRVPEGDVVIGYQAVGGGEIIVVADSSMFGYVLDSGDNREFVLDLATLGR
jgi:hypothetical protein